MKHKKNFIDIIVTSTAIQAAIQHRGGGSIFNSNNISDIQRRSFRNELKERIIDISKSYKANVSDETHIKNIESISNELIKRFPYLNREHVFAIAQKALNVYLKFMWCLYSSEWQIPPHCPIDRIILKKANIPVAWTRMNIRKYKTCIEQLKEIAKKDRKDSLASWELELWNNEIYKRNYGENNE